MFQSINETFKESGCLMLWRTAYPFITQHFAQQEIMSLLESGKEIFGGNFGGFL